MSYYIALFRQGQGGAWHADFPDFPECKASAPTLHLASSAATMALMQCASQQGKSFPRRRTLSDIQSDAALQSSYGAHLSKAIISMIRRPDESAMPPAFIDPGEG